MPRLAELNPKLAGGRLRFDCPHCGRQRLVVPVAGDRAWTMTGVFPDTLSLTPSVDASAWGHWHGYITNGDVQ